MNREVVHECEENPCEEFELIIGQPIERFLGKPTAKLAKIDWEEAAFEAWTTVQNRLAIMDR